MKQTFVNGTLSLEARSAIGDLVVEFSWSIDHGLAERVPDLCTDDASLLGIGEDLVGRHAIAGWARRRAAMRGRTSRHICTNLRLTAEAPDRARGTVLLTLFRHDDQPPGPALPLLVGEYDDIYERGSDDRWRFAERRFSTVFASPAVASSVRPDAAEALAPTRQNYRDAMAKLCAAVNVITTDGAAGLGGFTASAVCSVTEEPPTLLVCMNRGSSQAETFKRNGVVCVNVLSDSHESISALFAGHGGLAGAERFRDTSYIAGATGCPVLEEAVVSFDCTIDRVLEVGTHDVIFCCVRHIHPGSGVKALVYLNRVYHRV